MPQLIAPSVAQYLESLVPERPAELLAMEMYARKHRFPIIGPACGHLCYQVARMTGAKKIFELGSGFGYSTAFFAKAVAENGGGLVHHVVWDEDLSARARRHLKVLGLDHFVEFHIGEAVGTLEAADGPFDLIFNDIDKHAYPTSLPVVESKLRKGGVLIIDNMLWGGRIFDEADSSPDTEGVRELTRRLRQDPNWVSSLVPIRDGMIVAFRQ